MYVLERKDERQRLREIKFYDQGRTGYGTTHTYSAAYYEAVMQDNLKLACKISKGVTEFTLEEYLGKE